MRTTEDMGGFYAFAPDGAQTSKDGVPALPEALPENAGIAYHGEAAWPSAQLTAREAKQLAAATNACGRPNSDVLRQRLAVAQGDPVRGWQIDFPEHFTDQETALYERPFAHLGGAWRNPHANPELRRAIARISRYLAMPADADPPDWMWVEEDLLPDASLVVVARDDDFAHGLLSSRAFVGWYGAHRATTPADRIVASFPFPWPPGTTLNALTAAQEDSRHAIARAIRADNHESLNEAVARAYGWPVDLGDDELLTSVKALHTARLHPTPSSP
jgi:hypothetical protein